MLITALALLVLPAAYGSQSPWSKRSLSLTAHAKATVKPVASTWYAGWHPTDFPPEHLPWTKYTTVKYAFAATTPNPADFKIAPADDPIVKKVIRLGHSNNVAVHISIGGWTGSQYFSTSVGNTANRTAFIKAINNMVTHYGFDGVDFDWEYPNSQGIGCNTVNSKDTANFLELLKELRASSLPKKAVLSAATAIVPFLNLSGTPSSDVSQFAKYLDYIEVMNYDVWGSWSQTAGPNAPLNDSCVAKPDQAVGSAVSAVAAWTKAGIPAHQIVLGVAAYGHSFAVKKADALGSGKTLLTSFPPFNASAQPSGDKWDDAAGPDICGNDQPKGGIFNFWGLVDGGFLTKTGAVAPGIKYRFDSCSQTPSVYNSTSGVWVEFDDARSFRAKGKFIAARGLRGFSMWEAGGDYDDILLDAIRVGAGYDHVGGNCRGA
ncbi:glycoside hydrolase family 18 protein [Hydnum rufescens UP504]|uniref:Glycoside hydrolase family 18 protein n=1 Tax=Hydnum rufescens UP504 TaxID=1448309 RepID=A0A9P6ADB4_9AGAM|nr:glycoside hydrolase family 18 protein [Hydnum rufescens UP504]